jgi:protein TonB
MAADGLHESRLMRSLPLNGSGAWLAGVSFSLAGHLAAAATLIALEVVQPIDRVGPITVELILADETTLKKEPPVGETQPDDVEIETHIMAMVKPSAPPLNILSPSENIPRGNFLADALDVAPRKVSDTSPQGPRTQQIVVESSENIERQIPSTDAPKPESMNLPETVRASSLTTEPLPREKIGSISSKLSAGLIPLKTNQAKSPQGARLLTISRLPQAMPATPQLTMVNSSGSSQLELETAVEATEPSTSFHTGSQNTHTPAAVPDSDPLAVAAIPFSEIEDLGQSEAAAAPTIQVAVAVRPLSRTPGISRGVQVVAGNRPPEYPFAAKRRGLEGRVILRVEVDNDGTARRVIVTKSSGYKILDNAAQKAARHWKFLPALVDGKAVSGAVDVPFSFRLD